MRTLWWLAAILLSIFVVSYVFMHGNYHMPDDGWEAYSLQAAAKSMWHQDYFMLWRPGYLLNIPLVYLGFNHFEMKCVYFLCLVLATYWWVWGLNKSHLKTILFPISLITVLYLSDEPGSFNYYGNAVLFLILGLAAYLTARKVKHPAVFDVLSGIFFSQVVFGNLALFPGVLIGVIVLSLTHMTPSSHAEEEACVLRQQLHKPVEGGTNLLLPLSFLIFTAITLYLYFIPGHAWALNLKYHVPGQLLGDLIVKLLLGLIMLGFLIMGAIPWLFRKELTAMGYTRRHLILPAIILCVLAAALLLLQRVLSYTTISVVLMAPVSLWVIAQFYVLAWFKPQVSKKVYRTALLMLIVISLLMMNNRVISQGTWLGWNYFSICLVVFWYLAESKWQMTKRYAWYLVVLACFLALPVWNYSTVAMRALISVNAYPSKLGTNTTYLMAKMEKKYLAEYKKQGCANKPLLAYFDLPMMYFLVDRIAPFGQSWITGAKMVPDSKFLTNAHFEHWFKSHPHWCVVWHYSPRTSMGKIRFLKATALMKQMAKKKILLGYMGPKVWLYVK